MQQSSRVGRPRRTSELSSTYQGMSTDEEYSEEKVRALQRYVQRRFERMAEDVKREREMLGQLLDRYEERRHRRGYESTEGESAYEGGYFETTSESEVERMRHSKRYPSRGARADFDHHHNRRRYSIDSLGRDAYYYDSQESYPEQSSARGGFSGRVEGHKRSRRERKPSLEEPETHHHRRRGASFELPHRKPSGTESDDVYSFERLHSTRDDRRPVVDEEAEEEPRTTRTRSFDKTSSSLSPTKRDLAPSKHHDQASRSTVGSHLPPQMMGALGGGPHQRPRYSVDTASSRIRQLETERELVNRASQQVPAHDAVYPVPLYYAARLGVTI